MGSRWPPCGRYAAVMLMAPRSWSASRTNARPLSYGTLSHLWASVAQESAAAAPATRWACRGLAAAHSPNAPSTCTQAPDSCARRQISATGSNDPVFTLPTWTQTTLGVFNSGSASASLIQQGYMVRLTGQDSGRGTFFHRH